MEETNDEHMQVIKVISLNESESHVPGEDGEGTVLIVEDYPCSTQGNAIEDESQSVEESSLDKNDHESPKKDSEITDSQETEKVIKFNKGHVCPICDETFALKKILTAHMTTHTDNITKESSTGSQMDNMSSESTKTKRVGRKKAGRKPKRVIQSRVAKKPVKKENQVDDAPSYACTYCPKTFSTDDQLQRHWDRNMAGVFHICKMCNEVFQGRCQWMCHVKDNKLDQPKRCKECKESFNSKCLWNNHQETHHAVKTPEKEEVENEEEPEKNEPKIRVLCSEPVKYVTSINDKPKLVDPDGFLYLRRRVMNKRTHWSCEKKSCRAKVQTVGENIVRKDGTHNHESDKHKSEVEAVITTMKDRALATTDSEYDIVVSELKNLPPEVLGLLPEPQQLRRNLRYYRKKHGMEVALGSSKSGATGKKPEKAMKKSVEEQITKRILADQDLNQEMNELNTFPTIYLTGLSGDPKMIDPDGFVYMASSQEAQSINWICESTEFCKASTQTVDGSIVAQSKDHSHTSDIGRFLVREAVDKMRHRVITTYDPIDLIMESEIEAYKKATLSLLPDSTLLRENFDKIRKKKEEARQEIEENESKEIFDMEPVPAKYVHSRQGYRKLVDHNNYVYQLKEMKNKINKCRWMCEVRGKCKASAITLNDNIIRVKGTHTHPPNNQKEDVLESIKRMKEQALSTNRPLHDIIISEKECLADDTLERLPPQEHLFRILKQSRTSTVQVAAHLQDQIFGYVKKPTKVSGKVSQNKVSNGNLELDVGQPQIIQVATQALMQGNAGTQELGQEQQEIIHQILHIADQDALMEQGELLLEQPEQQVQEAGNEQIQVVETEQQNHGTLQQIQEVELQQQIHTDENQQHIHIGEDQQHIIVADNPQQIHETDQSQILTSENQEHIHEAKDQHINLAENQQVHVEENQQHISEEENQQHICEEGDEQQVHETENGHQMVVPQQQEHEMVVPEQQEHEMVETAQILEAGAHVDGNAQLISADGQLITAEGHVIDSEGQIIGTEEQLATIQQQISEGQVQEFAEGQEEIIIGQDLLDKTKDNNTVIYIVEQSGANYDNNLNIVEIHAQQMENGDVQIVDGDPRVQIVEGENGVQIIQEDPNGEFDAIHNKSWPAKFISKDNDVNPFLVDPTGYVYVYNRLRKGKTYWKCDEVSCAAKAQTIGDTIVYVTDDHNHGVDYHKEARLAILAQMRQRALVTSDSFDEIINSEMKAWPEELLAQMPDRATLLKNLENTRKRKLTGFKEHQGKRRKMEKLMEEAQSSTATSVTDMSIKETQELQNKYCSLQMEVIEMLPAPARFVTSLLGTSKDRQKMIDPAGYMYLYNKDFPPKVHWKCEQSPSCKATGYTMAENIMSLSGTHNHQPDSPLSEMLKAVFRMKSKVIETDKPIEKIIASEKEGMSEQTKKLLPRDKILIRYLKKRLLIKERRSIETEKHAEGEDSNSKNNSDKGKDSREVFIPARFVNSKTRNRKLVDPDGYLYHLKRAVVSGSESRWHCMHQTKCQARARTVGDMIVSLIGYHSHDAEIGRAEAIEAVDRMKTLAMETDDELKWIMRREIEALADNVRDFLPTADSMYRSLTRVRQQNRPANTMATLQETPMIVAPENAEDLQNVAHYVYQLEGEDGLHNFEGPFQVEDEDGNIVQVQIQTVT